MLSKTRNKKAAKKFFKKLLSNNHIVKPSVINVNKAPAFVPAHDELQKSKELNHDTKLRQVKYLNNSIVIDVIETLSENDSKRSITLCWQGYLRPK